MPLAKYFIVLLEIKQTLISERKQFSCIPFLLQYPHLKMVFHISF